MFIKTNTINSIYPLKMSGITIDEIYCIRITEKEMRNKRKKFVGSTQNDEDSLYYDLYELNGNFYYSIESD